MITGHQGKRATGHRYEILAKEYLISKKYQILSANLNYKVGEIDLVAEESLMNRRTLVFVEVRKRDSRGFIGAEETLTYPKRRRLLNAIQIYLLSYRGPATEVRIDLIGFLNDELRHWKNFIEI